MMRIEVDPGWLGVAAAGHSALGDEFAGLAGNSGQTTDAAVAGDQSLGHGIGAAAIVVAEPSQP